MKFRALLFSLTLAAGMGLPVTACAQDDQPKPAPDATPAQPADAKPAPPSAAPDQAPAASPDQAQPSASPDQTPPADAQDQAKTPQPQIKHDGGKNDVNAIGSRKVGGFDMYSIETDIKIGKAYSQQIERAMKMVDDPAVNEFVNRLGQNLARNSDAKVPFTFKIIDADDINAMSLPGGFVYINAGMILAADDEAELAGGMAHEIAHVALRHGTRGQSRAVLLQMLTIPVMVAGGPVGVLGPEVARLAVPVSLLKFSREFEAEADYFGLQYMYKAGYDPNGLVTFFEKVQAREKKKPGTVSKAFSTHPQTPDRISKSQREMSKILDPRDRYLETTSEFNDVRARLAMLENRRKMDDANQSKPNLRRASDPSDNGDKKDDHPNLQRHDQHFTLLGEK
jgi:predicted Zn-dependent protease